jgi:hypothetical protein
MVRHGTANGGIFNSYDLSKLLANKFTKIHVCELETQVTNMKSG